MPFNFYDFACWARGTVAPLTIVLSKKPVRELGVDVGEIVAPGTENEMKRVTGAATGCCYAEKLLKLYERLPRQPCRGDAQRRIAQWVVERQEADGSWGGIQPPWVYSLIALDLMGYEPRPSGDAQGHRGFGAFYDRRRARLAFFSLHVAGLGYGVGDPRACTGRFRRATSGDAPRRRTGCCASKSPTTHPATGE